jgi:DNA-binding transcriptional MerR regulator
MFRIGAFARVAGVSAKQLRAYDELGLFRPVWIDPVNRYRYYSPVQLPELRRIVALRQLAMPLDEIARLAVGGDLRGALERRRAELERERRAVEARLKALRITVADAGGSDIVVRPVGVEPVAVLRAAGDVGEAFYELESYVRDLGRRAHRPPGAFPATREIFVPVTGPVPTTERIAYHRLPACRAASVIHAGSYGGLGRARAALERWVAQSAFRADGPMRILYLQFGAEPELRVPRGYVVERDADFLTELQLPVR